MAERFDLTKLPPARELTDDEREARHQTCYALDQRVKSSLRKGREAMWEIAHALYEWDEESGWLALGFTTLKDWLAQPDVDLKESTYHAAVARWRQVVVLRQVDSERLESLDPSKVDLVLPAVRQGRAQLPAALEDVATKTARQLREQYAQPNGQKPTAYKPTPDDPDPEPYDADGELDELEVPVEDPPEDDALSEEKPPAQPVRSKSPLAEAFADAKRTQLGRFSYDQSLAAFDDLLAAVEAHLRECLM